jgi:hypothetical protein
MNKIKLGYWLTTFAIGIFLFSCKVQEKKNVKIRVRVKHRSSKFLVQKLKKNEFQFNTISAKAKTAIIDSSGKKTSFKTNIRIKKDSAIWLSITPMLGIEMARILITQDSVKFLNRASKEYFLGDFGYLNKLFGTELDYQMMEALLIGNSLDFDEKSKIHSRVDRKKDLYFLSTEKKRKVNKELKKEKAKIKKEAQVLWLNPLTFKVTKLLLTSPATKRSFSGKFSDYRKIEEQLIPYQLHFVLKSYTTSIIDVEYSKFSIGKSLSFPFKISSKYVEIKK